MHTVQNGAFIYSIISTTIYCVLMITGWLFITLGCVRTASRTKPFYDFDRNELSMNSVNKLVAQDKALVYCSGGVTQGVRELNVKFWLIYAP